MIKISAGAARLAVILHGLGSTNLVNTRTARELTNEIESVTTIAGVGVIFKMLKKYISPVIQRL